jgi:hypothetical protein
VVVFIVVVVSEVVVKIIAVSRVLILVADFICSYGKTVVKEGIVLGIVPRVETGILEVFLAFSVIRTCSVVVFGTFKLESKLPLNPASVLTRIRLIEKLRIMPRKDFPNKIFFIFLGAHRWAT